MAHLTVTFHHKIIDIQSQGFCFKFPDVGKNKKALLPVLRAFYDPDTGKPLFTDQAIADALGYKARQNVDNFLAEFRSVGGDMHQYLSPKNAKHDRLCEPIVDQILTSPALGLHQQYLAFREEYPEDALSETTFRKYAGELDVLKLLKRVQGLFSEQRDQFDARRYLQEILEMEGLSSAKKKEIVECFPEIQASSPVCPCSLTETVSGRPMERKLLVTLLYVCNVSQEMLSLLFGVSKTSIHRYIYDVCGHELTWQIVGQIVRWSGQVSVDEKWVNIDGQWWFVLCAVDAVSGFPLLIDLYPNLETVSWTLFFKRFKAVYGVPKLIQSDGSKAVTAAREAVFPGVRSQLCKFHKLHNLMTRLRQHIRDPKLLRRCLRLAKHIFTNRSVSSRKQAAKTLQKLAGQEMATYLEDHILTPWRKLTRSLTTNASERFNRKIEKCFFGRYGIPTADSAKVLLRGLWLKELLLNGQHHMEATSHLRSIDVSRICQEHLDPSKILHFFHDYAPSHVEKLA